MKFLGVASVAAILSATVSAGPLVPRDTCPKGYTQSVYYKTIYFEPSTSAVPESTATPSPTPVILESQTSVEPTLTPSSAAVVTSQAPAVEQVQSSTLSSAVAETSTSESAPIIALLPTSSTESLPAAETTSVVKAVEQTTQPAETTIAPTVKAVEQTTQTAETTTAPAPVAETAEPTTSAAETTAAPVVKAAVQSTSTTSSSSSSTSSSSSSSDSKSGEATFYGGNVSGGTCSFSGYSLPSTLFGTALSLARWDDAANCGRCVSVTGPKGNTVKAMIVDQCPECESNHLDLFQTAFAELSDISAGIIDINWSYVSCDLDGPLKLKNKEGTSAYWFSMQVVNANEAVTALDVSTDGGSSWQSTSRTSYNFFENSSGFGTDSVTVRVTGSSGNTVVVTDVGVSSGVEVTASSNL
ncbi:Expansin-like protein 1 [Penicillium brevicompactum]|uniref:Expansin-like protein 1 n=1 Tax=Penicillium brevicompactum TaxID=5074 RepID=A0A9W9R550_PENBR|nr:Expansin-like protein 1 [Penicillium brevicompactum]